MRRLPLQSRTSKGKKLLQKQKRNSRLPFVFCLITLVQLSLCCFGVAREVDLILPEQFQAFDIPNDDGRQIGLIWSTSPSDGEGIYYVIEEALSPKGPFREVKRIPSHRWYRSEAPEVFGPFSPWEKGDAHYVAAAGHFDSEGRHIPAYYRLSITDGEETTAIFPGIVTSTPHAEYFNWNKVNNLVVAILCCLFVFFFIGRAKKNPHLYIRRLPGLEAIDEAVGRATEMGSPITYLTGSYDVDQVSTIASVNILAHVARKVAEYDSRLIVPCKYSVAMSVCQETVREAYVNAGRPDAYNPDDIFYVAGEQFSYTAAVDGILVRERPAANFLLGTFAAEALILAETGAATGAIQIAGTDSFYQIPFFVVCCDYCLIGEELYAASAYLSREPRLLGTLKGQDAAKVALLLAILLAAGGIILSHVTGIDWWQNLALSLRPL